MQFKTEDNYAISLQGKWGCGKTSVLNMAIEEIEQLNSMNNQKPVIIKFNPWNYTDNNQLINQFFLVLSNELKIDNKNEKLNKVGNAIEKYSFALEYTKYIPVAGKYVKFIPKLFKNIGKSMKENSNEKLNDVSFRKGEVEKSLRELNNRIIIVIDDIDRLPNSQIKLIFQLVNSLAGFPNTTYLLSFDKDIVSRALSEVQNCNGEEYLEKIIQIPFDVPQLDESKLNDVLFENLNNLIYLPVGAEFDKERWSKVFNSCISPFISNLRDVNRFCNVFTFIYSNTKEEVDFIDMAGICSLKVFAYNIYSWIQDNRHTLVGGYNGGGISVSDVKNQKEERLKNFKEFYPNNPEIMLNAIACLFPKFSNRVSIHSNFEKTDQIHQAMRIASDRKFDVYFSMSLDNIKISRNELDASIFEMNENDLFLYVSNLYKLDLFSEYLREIKNNISRLPEERIDLILHILIKNSVRVKKDESNLFNLDNGRLSAYTMSDILFRISDENNRYKIIENMFLNSDFETFQYLLHFFHIIELTHGRIAETNHIHDEKLISIGNLDALEKIFLNKLKIFLKTSKLPDWKEFRRVAMLWENLEEIEYSKYVEDLIQNKLYAIKYIALYLGKWNSISGIDNKKYGYQVLNKLYEKYISTKDLLEIIEEERYTKEFWKLKDENIESVVAFYLLNESSSDNDINIHEIQEKIREWKNVCE